jgi:hypothetical protein
MVGVRLQNDQLAKLDDWGASQPPPKPSRPEAIRRLIELGLKAAERQELPARADLRRRNK